MTRGATALVAAVGLLSSACGGTRAGGVGRDAGAGADEDGRVGVDAHPLPDGSVDPLDGPDPDPDAETPGGICGPTGTWECGPVACHDNEACVARDLSTQGYDGYVECGSARSFSEGDSQSVCMLGPPWGSWPIEFHCGLAQFRGTLRFFCAPDRSAVVTRYQVHATMPMTTGTDLYTSLGYDYQDSSSGGSGGGHLHLDESGLIGGTLDFVGYHRTGLPMSSSGPGSSQSTVYFIVDPYFPSATTMPRYIGGGYSVSFGPDGPAG